MYDIAKPLGFPGGSVHREGNGGIQGGTDELGVMISPAVDAVIWEIDVEGS